MLDAAHVIQLTYQEASSETIKPMLGGLDDAALAAFAAEHEWEKLDNDQWMVGNKVRQARISSASTCLSSVLLATPAWYSFDYAHPCYLGGRDSLQGHRRED